VISKLEIFENALVENLQSPFASYWAEAESDANNILEAAKVGTDAADLSPEKSASLR
jgi:hypothetical protein